MSSNYGGDFIVPDGNSETIYLNPIWTTGSIPGSNPAANGPVFTGNYDLFVTRYGNANITIDATDSLVTVNQNGQNFSLGLDGFGGGHIRNITVAAGVGASTINIQDLAADQILTVLGGGSDTVNVGKNGSVQGIQGTVNISNPPNFTTLNVDDSADVNFRSVFLDTFGLGGSSGAITGLAPGEINFKYADTRSVTPARASAAPRSTSGPPGRTPPS